MYFLTLENIHVISVGFFEIPFGFSIFPVGKVFLIYGLLFSCGMIILKVNISPMRLKTLETKVVVYFLDLSFGKHGALRNCTNVTLALAWLSGTGNSVPNIIRNPIHLWPRWTLRCRQNEYRALARYDHLSAPLTFIFSYWCLFVWNIFNRRYKAIIYALCHG